MPKLDLDQLHESENFDCKICSGTGFRIEDRDGATFAVPCSCSAERKFLRQLRLGGLPRNEYLSKRMENFEIRCPEHEEMVNMANAFLADPEATGIGYFGNAGTGKTFICTAICLELLKAGKVHKYFGFRKEITNLLKLLSTDKSAYVRAIEHWSNVPYLYIDDLWKMSVNSEGKVNRAELQAMYEIINSRYMHRMPTIFSSEYTTGRMEKIDSALASRIFEMCSPYGMTCRGDNQRFNKRRAV